jgi:hypothetical protein
LFHSESGVARTVRWTRLAVRGGTFARQPVMQMVMMFADISNYFAFNLPPDITQKLIFNNSQVI